MRMVAGVVFTLLLSSVLSFPALAAADKAKWDTKKGPASAAKSNYEISLTPTIGEYFFQGKDNLKSSPMYAVKLSYNVLGSKMMDSLGVDAVVGYIDTTSTTDNSKAKVYHLRVDALYPFIFKKSKITPFLAIGGGGNIYERTDSTKGKGLIGYGGGVKYRLLDYLDVRADVRHIILATAEKSSNVEFSAGLTYVFGVERKSKEIEKEKKKKEEEKKKQVEKEKKEKEKEKTEKEKKEEQKPEVKFTGTPQQAAEKALQAAAKADLAAEKARQAAEKAQQAIELAERVAGRGQQSQEKNLQPAEQGQQPTETAKPVPRVARPAVRAQRAAENAEQAAQKAQKAAQKAEEAAQNALQRSGQPAKPVEKPQQ